MTGLNLETVADLDKKQEQTVTDEINCPKMPPSRVAHSIICAFPGQVAFCIPQIREDEKYMQRLLALLANEPLVINQQVNTTMLGSIAITYKSDLMSDVDMRSHLANLIQLAGNAEVVSASANQFKPCSTAVTTEDRQDRKPKREAQKQTSATFSLSSADASVSKRLFEKCFTVTLGTFRSPLPHASRSTWGDPKTALAPLKKGGTGVKVPLFKGDLGGSKTFDTNKRTFQTSSKTKSNSASSADSVIQQPKKPAKVAYSIAHAIPGRVRFRVPGIACDPKYVQRLETLLKSDSTVTSERVNSAARSVVITYKTGMMRNSQKRVQSFLLTPISHLVNLIESANDPATAIS
ncbi:hypothetical protein LC653_05090 [Nostoc sp. CHAB 5784]|uniref:hypothetical protein n=1 Tax=Nostoc mirabile TaxID=2907820 RepID=UPI001E57C35C|nr:hypothetical protein [Nostoc mirabile]MCC5663323.1 hypothetical protein [Nostoc mirabile CHAB5784]